MKNVLYKRRLKYGLWLVGGMALVSACTDNLVNEALPWEKTLDLQATIQQENVTRANDNGFADGDQIGVFVVNYDSESSSPELQLTGNHADNVRFTYDDTGYRWTGSYQLYWKDEKTPVDVYGYYPFIPQLSSIIEQPFAVEQNQCDTPKGETFSGYEKSDFLWAKAENITPTDATITLNHNHIMAGIEVVLVEGYGFDENEWANAERNVLVQNVVLAGTVNLRDGSVTCTGATDNTGIIPQEDRGKYRAIVLPQTIQAGVPLFSITIDGQAKEFIRLENMKYYRGKLHKFTIEVNKSLETGDYELNLLSDAIVNWENDPLSHNGTAREYVIVHVNEGEYLGDVVKRMGIEDPSLIRNLKLTGCIDRIDNFDYIHEYIPYLEAVNLKDLRTKNMPSYWRYDVMVKDKYGQPYFADDYLPGDWGTSDPDDGSNKMINSGAAFEHMIFLQYVVWPEHLKGIGDNAFAGCPLRGSLVFPEGLKHIGNNVFAAYSHKANNLTGELYIPSTVEYIGDGAFGGYSVYPNFVDNTTYLTGEIVLPSHMKFLGRAFANCPRLTGQIHIPDGLTELNKFAGPQMTGDVIIPQGIKKINGLGGSPSSIYIPEGVEEISKDAFRGLSSLKGDIKIPTTVKTIGTAAFRGTSISHISLPEKLEIISDELLLGCKFLQDTLTIPSSVIQIKSGAFEGCEKLNAIILPESLEQIWGNALNGCWSLDYIQCNAKTPPIVEGGNFTGLEKNNFTLVVPEGSVDAYRNAPGWNEFKRISAYRNFVCRPMKARLLNKAAKRTILLNADGNWKMTHCPSWIHVDKTSGSKKTELSVSIDAMAHGSADRTDSVVFTLQDKVDEDGNPIICYYKVEQYDYQCDEDSQLQLHRHTKGKGVNIVFIGDGYDAKDISKENYLNDVREGMEYFFAIEPYKTYKDYFDVYVDFPLSYESGVCSNVNIWRTTKFDTTYGAGAGGRLKVNFDDMMSYVLNDVTGTVVTADNVDRTLIISILNSDVYEGLTSLWATGVAIAAVPHSRYGYPNDYRGLIQHEAGGHGFGKLDDEYVYHREHIRKCPCIDCTHAEAVEEAKNRGWSRNVSLTGRYDEIDWRHLIFDNRYQDIVDIYEGAHMHSNGIYRSEYNSCMNNNVPYYSTISRQAIVERIMDYAGEAFNFENFAAKDSREMGDKFITRSGSAGSVSASIKGNMPEIVKSSPLKNLKRKVKYNTKKQQAR
ncbi:MAG: fimbrillin family protein [Paraprevotella sp.]|nr:fimbrillin family protein [Paraprevotella sp.]